MPMRIPALVATMSVVVLAGEPRQAAQTPVRDAAAQPRLAGTASISGLIVDAATDSPLVGAVVRVRVSDATGERPGATTLTDADGRYELARLPSGVYVLSATFASYADVTFGQKKLNRPGTPLTLADRQQMKDVMIRMTRGGVIAGTILNQAGRPAPGSGVNLLRVRYGSMGQSLEQVPTSGQSGTADDRGQYRFWGLAAGDYVVAARPSQGGYVTTFYPGVVTGGQAALLHAEPGQERTGVDVPLLQVPLVSVRGNVLAPGGQAITGGFVSLIADDDRPARTSAQPNASITAGQFTFERIPPGQYTLLASSAPLFTEQPVAGTSWGSLRVTVAARDVNDLSVVLQAGVRVAGRVRFEGQIAPVAATRAYLFPVGPATGLRPNEYLRAPIDAEGRFAIESVPPGQYFIDVPVNLVSGWSILRMARPGRNLLHAPLEVTSDDIADVEIVFTDRGPTISGAVSDGTGQPLVSGTVILFPSDRTVWTTMHLAVSVTNTGPGGRFHLPSLMAGDYLIAAVEDVEENQWFDPRYLERVAAVAQRITIASGDKKVVSLQVRNP